MENKKGSALVFALIMLSVMIVIAVGSFSASVVDQKTSNDTEKSVSAFQSADTGVEKVLQIINSAIETGGSLQTLSSVGLCNNGSQYVDETSLNGRKIAVSFYKTGSVLISDCSLATISEINHIKSIGEFGGTVRAVSVALKGNPCAGVTTVDYGSRTYNTVAIGAQCWLKENLNVGTMLASGATVPADPAPTIGDPNTVSKWCYNNDINICNTDGGLYTWAESNALVSSCNSTDTCIPPTPNQGICPTGWHLPTDEEYKILEMQLEMSQAQADATGHRGTDQGSQLSTFTLNGTNSSGFTALLVGARLTTGGFIDRGSNTFFWSASPGSAPTGAWDRYLLFDYATVGRAANGKSYGFSVRCVKN